MKPIALLIIYLFFYSSSNYCQSSILEVQIYNIHKIESKKTSDNLYSVNIDLINRTDYNVIFWTMTCSWQENWIFSEKNISLDVCCDKNYPTKDILRPVEKKTYDGIIMLTDSIKSLKKIQFKIGFIFIKENEISNKFDVSRMLMFKKAQEKDIFWSNAFELDL